jgi:hypothetical protein
MSSEMIEVRLRISRQLLEEIEEYEPELIKILGKDVLKAAMLQMKNEPSN